MRTERRWPIGAELLTDGAHFRVWALGHQRVEVVLESGRAEGTHPLKADPDGYFSALIPGAAAGDRYRFRLGDRLYPDPVSRFQPEGPHGPSQIVDPAAFAWTDRDWRGVSLRGQVLY
jgi:maltooligosyltrehalose trehalohydrolase